MTDETAKPTPPPSHLSYDQQARVDALKAARGVLSDTTTGPFSKASTAPEVFDLVHVARFIMTGEDPWDDETAEERREGVLRLGMDD